MEPIDTGYGGCAFRSRLEARWAVFFDHLGLEWEYEPQGFELAGEDLTMDFPTSMRHVARAAAEPGYRYLPDFQILISEWLFWIEIKPNRVDLVDPLGLAKWNRFSRLVLETRPQESACMFVGLPDPDKPWFVWPGADSPYETGAITKDGWWPCFWCVCSSGRHVGIEPDGIGSRIRCGCAAQPVRSADHPRIVEALKRARSYRFGQ